MDTGEPNLEPRRRIHHAAMAGRTLWHRELTPYAELRVSVVLLDVGHVVDLRVWRRESATSELSPRENGISIEPWLWPDLRAALDAAVASLPEKALPKRHAAPRAPAPPAAPDAPSPPLCARYGVAASPRDTSGLIPPSERVYAHGRGLPSANKEHER